MTVCCRHHDSVVHKPYVKTPGCYACDGDFAPNVDNAARRDAYIQAALTGLLASLTHYIKSDAQAAEGPSLIATAAVLYAEKAMEEADRG